MKYLVVLLVVVVVAWLLLRTRSRAPARPKSAASTAVEVVACRHCGVHLPRADGVEDGSGTYCSPEHRAAGPRRE
jgi:uncharacterized protein